MQSHSGCPAARYALCMRHSAMRARPLVLVFTVPLVTGCAPLLQAMGSGVSAIQVAVQVDRLKLLADGVSYANSRKTLTDHALSGFTDQDCKLWNVTSGTRVCTAKPASATLPPIIVVRPADEDTTAGYAMR